MECWVGGEAQTPPTESSAACLPGQGGEAQLGEEEG